MPKYNLCNFIFGYRKADILLVAIEFHAVEFGNKIFLISTNIQFFFYKLNFLLNQSYKDFIISSRTFYNENGYYKVLFIIKLYSFKTVTKKEIA